MARHTNNLWPEHTVEISLRGLKGAQTQAGGKKSKAACRQQTGIDALLQYNGDWSDRELRQARNQHDRPNLQRVVIPDEGEKDRHQIDGPEQTYPQNKTQNAADCEVAVGETAKVKDRVGGADGATDKAYYAGYAQGQQSDYKARRPSALWRVLERKFQCRQGHRDQDQ